MEGNSNGLNKGILLGLLGSAVIAGSAFTLYSKKQKESQEKTKSDHPNAKRIIAKSVSCDVGDSINEARNLRYSHLMTYMNLNQLTNWEVSQR